MLCSRAQSRSSHLVSVVVAERFLPTYNHQIQQRFAALPLLQLGLDVDGLPGLPRGASRGGRGRRRLVPVGASGRRLGPPGRAVRGGQSAGVLGAAASACWAGHDPVLPSAGERRWAGYVWLKHKPRMCIYDWVHMRGTWERQSPWSASCRRRSYEPLWAPPQSPAWCPETHLCFWLEGTQWKIQ